MLSLIILAKESTNPFPLSFSQVQYLICQREIYEATEQKNMKTFYKAPIFFPKKFQPHSGLVHVCSAKVPLLSPHYLAWKVDPVTACISTLREIRGLSAAWSGGIHAVL